MKVHQTASSWVANLVEYSADYMVVGMEQPVAEQRVACLAILMAAMKELHEVDKSGTKTMGEM